MNYDYLDAMVEDIKEAYNEHDEWHDEEKSDLRELMKDELWIDDSVTGNASGSYTFDRYTAKEYVTANMDFLIEACNEFGIDEAGIGSKFLEEDWEWMDVTIRCYLLSEAIDEFLDNNLDD